jgi:methyl-accepting chemotaxis protein
MLGWKKSGAADVAAKFDAVSQSQAVIEFNLDGTIITANQNFLGAMELHAGRDRGKHHSMFVEPAYRESARYKEFWEKLRRGEYQSSEYKRLAKGGKEVWIEASYNPVRDQSGKPVKVIKFATDITAKATAQHGRRQARSRRSTARRP